MSKMPASVPAKALTPGDVAAILQTSRDYIEGWYDADPVRMERALHPDLVKRTVTREPVGGEWRLGRTTDGPMLVDYTREGGGSSVPKPERIHEITILDGFRHIACVKALSPHYVDYIQLAKLDGRWMIVNVIWEVLEGDLAPY